MEIFYKIVRIKSGEFHTLFHNINGTSHLPVGEWIRGERKEHVRDGSGDRYYTSGIHVVKGLEETRKYCKRFKKSDRVIVKCLADGLRKKEHSTSEVYLADSIKILDTEIISIRL